MTDAEPPDQPDEEERPPEAAPHEHAEAGRAAEAEADEDVRTGEGPAAPGSDPVPAPESGPGQEPGMTESEAGEEPAAPASEAGDGPTTETETESVAASEPERPQSAVPGQAPPPQPVEDPEDIAAAETTPESSQPARPDSSRSAAGDSGTAEESIPGAHLEPDLVLEQPPATDEPDYSRYAETDPEAELEAEAAAAGDPDAASEPTDREPPAPEPRAVLDLGADARYRATGKRKTSVARVILRPGSGTYTINGRSLEQFFPRATLRIAARQPLQTTGFEDRMDVVARLHGGGVSSQAGALRHGIARALVEADPALRGELKRHGFLTRDARAKERKKAGLKKARKRPQFSKR